MIYTKADFEAELKDFHEDLRNFGGLLFWPERTEWLFDFEGHPTIDKDSNERLTETLVGMALRAGSDYVIDAKWDEGALDNGEYMMVIELVPALIDVPHFNAGTGQQALLSYPTTVWAFQWAR